MNKSFDESSPMSKEEIQQRAKDFATPINFDELIASGVIEKKGAWYQINRWKDLPEHAKAKISEAQTGTPMLVKFRAPSKSLSKLIE